MSNYLGSAEGTIKIIDALYGRMDFALCVRTLKDLGAVWCLQPEPYNVQEVRLSTRLGECKTRPTHMYLPAVWLRRNTTVIEETEKILSRMLRFQHWSSEARLLLQIPLIRNFSLWFPCEVWLSRTPCFLTHVWAPPSIWTSHRSVCQKVSVSVI